MAPLEETPMRAALAGPAPWLRAASLSTELLPSTGRRGRVHSIFGDWRAYVASRVDRPRLRPA